MTTYVVIDSQPTNPYAFKITPAPPGNLVPPQSIYEYSITRGVIGNFITRPNGSAGGQFWPRGQGE